MFFLREGGVRLGLVVEGENGRLGLALVMNCLRLHIPFSIGVSSQTGKKQSLLSVCESSFSFFLREKVVRLGLVVEGEDGRLGLALVMICLRLHIPFSTRVSSQTGKKQALLSSVSSSGSGFGYSSIHSKFLAHCLTDGKGRAPFGRARPFWRGMPNFD